LSPVHSVQVSLGARSPDEEPSTDQVVAGVSWL